MEVKRAKRRSEELLDQLASSLKAYDYLAGLWNEFEPGLISVKDVVLETAKIAGIKTPMLKEVLYEVKPYNLFTSPLWYTDGVSILKQLAQLGIESEIFEKKM